VLCLTVKGSRCISAALIAAHAAAVITLAPLEIPRPVQLAFACALALSLAHAVRRHAFLKSSRSVVAVEIRRRDGVAVLTRDGQWREAQLLDSTYISPVLSVMNLRVGGCLRAWHVLFTPDNCDPEMYRRLRVWLRWGCRNGSRNTDAEASKRRERKLFSFSGPADEP
jgi:toxin CptA